MSATHDASEALSYEEMNGTPELTERERARFMRHVNFGLPIEDE